MKQSKLFETFKSRCDTVTNFTKTKVGTNLKWVCVSIFALLFIAPLFHGAVGAALIGCVGAPMTILIWRRYDNKHAIVPAVLFCIPMVIDMILYMSLTVASCMLVAAVCTLLVAMYPSFSYIRKIKDDMYAYLYAGAVCVAIVILASLIIALVSIAWWLFCLVLFLAFVAVFFSVVLSTAAYTATDYKRQARKKELRQYDLEESAYDFDVFAHDLGIKREYLKQRPPDNEKTVRRKKQKSESELYYDVD